LDKPVLASGADDRLALIRLRSPDWPFIMLLISENGERGVMYKARTSRLKALQKKATTWPTTTRPRMEL